MSTTAVLVDDERFSLTMSCWRSSNEGRDPARALQEAVVLDLYREAVVSAGRAAELLGMAEWDFVRWAGERGVPAVRMSETEFEVEIAAA